MEFNFVMVYKRDAEVVAFEADRVEEENQSYIIWSGEKIVGILPMWEVSHIRFKRLKKESVNG